MDLLAVRIGVYCSMSTKPLTWAEGEQRGKEDRAARMSYDPYRWVKAWAPYFWRFEQGYVRGFYS